MEKNLTTGSVFGNIVRFSLPYLFSYFLQTLYGMADLFIIGQYADASGTTAVSVGSQVMHMLTVMIVGLAMGATVTIGQAVGARDQKSAARYTGNTMTLFLVLSVAVMGLLLALARPIAAVMSTPAEAVPGTVAYLRICFLGVPLITAYNIIASINASVFSKQEADEEAEKKIARERQTKAALKVASALKEVDMNNLTPLLAFDLVNELSKQIKESYE